MTYIVAAGENQQANDLLIAVDDKVPSQLLGLVVKGRKRGGGG